MQKIISTFNCKVIFLILLILFISFLPKVAKAVDKEVYVFDKKGEWSTLSTFDIFSVDSVKNEKILAPGSKGSYRFTVKNGLGEDADYRLILSDVNQAGIPLLFRVRTQNGKWLLGGKDQWETNGSFPFSYKDILPSKGETQIEIEWLWKFEDNQDKLDSDLGNQAIKEKKDYQLAIKIYAEASVDKPKYADSLADFLPKTGEKMSKVEPLIGLLIISLIIISMSCRRKCQS